MIAVGVLSIWLFLTKNDFPFKHKKNYHIDSLTNKQVRKLTKTNTKNEERMQRSKKYITKTITKHTKAKTKESQTESESKKNFVEVTKLKKKREN